MDDTSAVLELAKLSSESDSQSDNQKEDASQKEKVSASTSATKSFASQTETVAEACKIADEHLKGIFIKNFLQLINSSEFEFGFNTPADHYVREALDKYGIMAREWINSLFLDNFDSALIVSSILRIIANFDYNQMRPQGMTMATAATTHINAEVRECGVRCFESWEAPESLTILKNIGFTEKWLKEYLTQVIADLEDLSQHVAFG